MGNAWVHWSSVSSASEMGKLLEFLPRITSFSSVSSVPFVICLRVADGSKSHSNLGNLPC